MDFPDQLDSNARVGVRKGTGTTYARRRVSLIEGTNVSFTVADDPTNEEVDITVAVASAAPSGAAGGTLGGTYPDPTVNTDGSTLETSANALRVKDGGITQAKLASGYRAIYVGTSAPGSPTEGDEWHDTTNDVRNVYNGSAWLTITPQAAAVATEQTTTSTSYADLSTSGPAVTVATGTKALVRLGCQVKNTGAANIVAMGFAVSGASTVAASDGAATVALAQVAGYYQQLFREVLVTGLTAGNNTFTAKYRVGGGTGSFLRRDISVVALP